MTQGLIGRGVERVRAGLAQARYATQLLLDRRLGLFLLADTMLLIYALISIQASGARGKEVYQTLVVFPMILLGLPAIAGVLALERRAGSLDLALAVPSTERYFLRRLAPVCVFLVLQGALILSLTVSHPQDLTRALAQSLVAMVLIASVVLFWAVRLHTAGAVMVASSITLVLLMRWLFYDPTFNRAGPGSAKFLGLPVPWIQWGGNFLVLVGATLLFFAYARQRLRRPETLLF